MVFEYLQSRHKQLLCPGVDKIFSCLPAQHLLPGTATLKEKTQWTTHAPDGCVHRASVQGVDPNNLDSYLKILNEYLDRLSTNFR